MAKVGRPAKAPVAVKKRPAAAKTFPAKKKPAAASPARAKAPKATASPAKAKSSKASASPAKTKSPKATLRKAAASSEKTLAADPGHRVLLAKVAACLHDLPENDVGATAAAGYAALRFGHPRHPWEEEVAAMVSELLSSREDALRSEAAPPTEAGPLEEELEALKVEAAERAAVAKRQAAAEKRAAATVAAAEASLAEAREGSARAADRSRDLARAMAESFAPLRDGTASGPPGGASPSAAKRLRLTDGASPSASPSAYPQSFPRPSPKASPKASPLRRCSKGSAGGHAEELLSDLHHTCKLAGVPWPSVRAQWSALLRQPSARSDLEAQAVNRFEVDVQHTVSMADLAVMSGPKAAVELERTAVAARQERDFLAEEYADGAEALRVADERLEKCRNASKAARRSEVLRPAAEARLAAFLDGPHAAFRALEALGAGEPGVGEPCAVEAEESASAFLFGRWRPSAAALAEARAFDAGLGSEVTHEDAPAETVEDAQVTETRAGEEEADKADAHADAAEDAVETPKPRQFGAPQKSEVETPKVACANSLEETKTSPAKCGSPIPA